MRQFLVLAYRRFVKIRFMLMKSSVRPTGRNSTPIFLVLPALVSDLEVEAIPPSV